MKEDIKVIFLDVDGVLNSYEWLYSNPKIGKTRNHLDDNAVEVLSKIVKSSKAKIVLSSSWRTIPENTEPMLQLKEKFQKLNLSIFDRTGRSPKKKSRGWEIREWIKKNSKIYNITSFVIIDDDSFDIVNHKKTLLPYYVKTSFKDGLKESHIPKILHVLNGGKMNIVFIPKREDPDWKSDKLWFRKYIQQMIDE
jgi:3-deoxy-D-manno-octulosonate 8-phosphate phosphatase KdsC-like HAD superfamily phosphatase